MSDDQHTTHTDGGATFSGHIDNQGGTLIGRDQINVTYQQARATPADPQTIAQPRALCGSREIRAAPDTPVAPHRPARPRSLSNRR